jgi:hypothetical protein
LGHYGAIAAFLLGALERRIGSEAQGRCEDFKRLFFEVFVV